MLNPYVRPATPVQAGRGDQGAQVSWHPVSAALSKVSPTVEFLLSCPPPHRPAEEIKDPKERQAADEVASKAAVNEAFARVTRGEPGGAALLCSALRCALPAVPPLYRKRSLWLGQYPAGASARLPRLSPAWHRAEATTRSCHQYTSPPRLGSSHCPVLPLQLAFALCSAVLLPSRPAAESAAAAEPPTSMASSPRPSPPRIPSPSPLP